MELVYLFYGFAFLALGLVLAVLPKRDSQFELALLIRWLTAFALLHGATEWMILARLLPTEMPALSYLIPLALLLSFVVLFEFGRRLVRASRPIRGASRWLLGGWIHVVLLGAIMVGGLLGDNPIRDLEIGSRYLYGFIGSLLTAAGFFLYCTHRIQPVLGSGEFLVVWRACVVSGLAFAAYAVAGGLVVPREEWGPAAWINTEAFQELFHIPVQLFRAFLAVVIAVSVAYILKIFHLEREQRIQTALAKAEAAREEADRLARSHRQLLESVGEGIFGIDQAGNTTFINPAALRMLGFSLDEIIGKPAHALTHHSRPDGHPFHVEECPTHQTLLDGQTRHVESDHFWRKDGSHFPVDYHTARIREQDKTVGAVVVFQDISERLRSEAELADYRDHLEEQAAKRSAALKESELRSRLILEASSNGLYGIDADGRIIFMNPAGSRMLGYSEDALIGLPAHITLHHTHADGMPFPANACPMLAALREGCLVSNDDDLFWRADGTPLPVATATQPMIDQGRIVGAVVSFVDMRQRKALDAARDHALHEAERLARVRSEFLANMSHEIRTPLNGVLGMAHIGYRHSGGTGKTGDAFAKIIQSGQLLLGIINDILDFSKIEAGKFKIESVPVELVAVMRDAVNVMHERAQAKGLNLRVKKGKDFPAFCLGDPLRLSQILVNLLSNAIKFTERGSVTLSATHTGGQLVFKVIDTGIGMTPEQIDRLYQPFEQADGSTTRRYGGTGLGLSITLRLLELMGGEIRVESVPGEGSTFEVRLPFVPANPPEVAEVPAEKSAARDGLPLRGLTILVAEDNPVNQEVIKATLLGEGAKVVMAENGLEAVACVERGDTFDIVLMDIQMPVMGGFEATRRIREIAPDLPIIGQTANAFAEDRKACLEAGMVDHIAKPIDVQVLIESIRRHVSGN